MQCSSSRYALIKRTRQMASKTIYTRIGKHIVSSVVQVVDEVEAQAPVAEETPKPKRRVRKKAEKTSMDAVPSSTPDENTPA